MSGDRLHLVVVPTGDLHRLRRAITEVDDELYDGRGAADGATVRRAVGALLRRAVGDLVGLVVVVNVLGLVLSSDRDDAVHWGDRGADLDLQSLRLSLALVVRVHRQRQRGRRHHHRCGDGRLHALAPVLLDCSRRPSAGRVVIGTSWTSGGHLSGWDAGGALPMATGDIGRPAHRRAVLTAQS